jgi:radical SAM protein with 4Fe4S-binding SPASM domain
MVKKMRAYGGRLRKGERSLHLRFEKGKALLIIDGIRVITLNLEAAFIADLLLQGKNEKEVEREVFRSFYGADRGVVTSDVHAVAGIIDGILRGEEPCFHRLEEGGGILSACDFEEILDPEVPFRADLALTYDCTNRCSHCYAGTQPHPGALDPEEWKKIIDRLRDIGVPYVCFTGGEPTSFEGLEGLVDHASREGLITGVLTSGRKFSDMAFAARLREAGLDYVQVTLESADEETHDGMVRCRAWRETVEGIRNCVSLGLYTVTNTTLTRMNAATAAETAAFAAGLGARTVAANHVIQAGKARQGGAAPLAYGELACVVGEMARKAREGGARFLWYSPTPYCLFNPFELDLGPKRCSAASGSIAVDPSGRVLPCQSFFLPAGNLLRDDWHDIRDGHVFNMVRKWRSSRYACGGCPDAGLCRGGCPLEEGLDLQLAAAAAAAGRCDDTWSGHERAAL